MSDSRSYFDVLLGARRSILLEFSDLANKDDRISFCENIKTLLCELELMARYN